MTSVKRRGRMAAGVALILALAILSGAALALGREAIPRWYVWRNHSRLCELATPRYDPWTGRFSVDYTSSTEMGKELLFPRGPLPRLSARSLPMRPPGWQPGDPTPLACFGSTQGLFLFHFPFKGEVVLEYWLQIGMMKSDGAIRAIVASSGDGKDFHAANLATVEVWRGGELIEAKRPADPLLLGRLKQKLASEAKMTVRYAPQPGGGEARIEVWCDTGGGEQLLNSASVPARSGRLGFAWESAKFLVWRISIQGTLDLRETAALLRALEGSTGQDAPEAKQPVRPRPSA